MKPNLFRCEVKDSHGDIFLYGEIGGGWFGGVTAEEVAKQIKTMGKIKTATVHVNSLGGDFFDGIAIRSSLTKLNASLDIIIDGIAASAATAAIAIPDVPIVMAEGSRYMIHDPWTITAGNSADFRKAADLLDSITEDMVAIYDKRTNDKIDAEGIREMMLEETWLSAEDATHYGFASEVSGEVAIAACPRCPQVESHFRNMPKLPEVADCTIVQNESEGEEAPVIMPFHKRLLESEIALTLATAGR